MDAEAKARKWALLALGAAVLILAGTLFFMSLDRALKDGGSPPPSAELSIDQLEDAVKANPEDGVAWSKLGMAWFEREEFAKAVPAFERATELIPGKADLWSLLGEARFKAAGMSSMPPAAIEAFKKALAIYPSDPAARYYMAVAKDLSGDHEGA
ncbi:MAG: tetratricopeptide repeat protein, partial [Sphingomonas sp.]